MSTSYNQVAGTSVERLAALSDGVFAVAMTLLVLDLRAPEVDKIRSEQDLWVALGALAPKFLMCAMTFLTLGIFWIGQQTQLNHLTRSAHSLSAMHLLFLFAVCMTPFSTMLLAGFITFRLAMLVYWVNILLLGVSLYFTWVCAIGLGVVREDLPPAAATAIKRRIVLAQSLYAFGALLCLVNTYLSIGFFVLVQLNYAIAPRLPGRRGSA